MKWIDDIAAAFPRRREDEPADLRTRIVSELRDHLECAYRAELLKTADAADAEQRVLARFGDPRRIARKLWLEAMQEKIMSQRIQMFWSALMCAACLAMGAFVYRIVEHSAETNRALLEQSRALNQALLDQLERQRVERAPGAPNAAPANDSAGSANAASWVQLRLQLVKDHAGGTPAPEYKIRVTNRDEDPHATVIDLIGKSDSDGQFDAGLLAPGQYFIDLETPWGEKTALQKIIQLRAGKAVQTAEFICPGAAPPEYDLRLDVEWPEDLLSRNVGILLCGKFFNHELAGEHWVCTAPEPEFRFDFLVTTRGVVLKEGGFSFLRSPDQWGHFNNNEIPQLLIDRVTPRPMPIIRWKGRRYAFHIKGIVIFEPCEPDSSERLFVEVPEGDVSTVSGEFDPAQANSHVKIPVSAGLVANLGRVMDGRNPRASRPSSVNGGDGGGYRSRGKTAEIVYEEAHYWADYGKHERAVQLYSNALQLIPKLADLDIRGELIYALQEPKKVVQDRTEKIRLDPKDSYSYSRRGHARFRLGELDKALEDFSEAIGREPQNGSAYFGRAQTWERKGEFDKAIADFGEAIRIRVKDNEDYETGRRRFAFRFPAPPYAERARLWIELGETKACEIADWHNRHYFETLAAAHAEAGELDLAAQWEARALEMMKGANEKPSSAELKQAEDRLELYRSGKPYREHLQSRTAKRDAPP
ncbi:MAG: tetratricopeptide repeat protein [Planctomycetia bacterium]|nr:tetratricopeptide repeat protein [Planctomycetia bacterium]